MAPHRVWSLVVLGNPLMTVAAAEFGPMGGRELEKQQGQQQEQQGGARPFQLREVAKPANK